MTQQANNGELILADNLLVPWAHPFIPIPPELITYGQIHSRLAQYQAQAWLFVYVDGHTHQPFSVQAVRNNDIPTLFTAFNDPNYAHDWRTLALWDVTASCIKQWLA